MTLSLEGPPLRFDEVTRLVFRPSWFVGPQAPIIDPRFCAGMLFEPRGDTSERTIFRGGVLPLIKITWHHDLSPSQHKHFPTTDEVVETLFEEEVLESVSAWGNLYSARSLRLNNRGNEQVLTKWFANDPTVGIGDYLAAGATFTSKSGPRW
jgi:hypothetical protein